MEQRVISIYDEGWRLIELPPHIVRRLQKAERCGAAIDL